MNSNDVFRKNSLIDLKRHGSSLDLIRTDPQSAFDLGIYAQPPAQEVDLFFSPVFLFQTCLPIRQVQEKHLVNGAYVRRNGDLYMEMRSTVRPDFLPYGKFPRQFLMWLTNAITRYPESLNGEGEFRLDFSFRAFCRSMGVCSSTGEKGSGRAMIDQIIRLMATTFVIQRRPRIGSKEPLKIRTFAISSNLELAWDEEHSKPKQWMDSIDGKFRLSRDFCAEIRDRAMPIDSRHLSVICKGRSALRIDVYHFLVSRNYALNTSGKHGQLAAIPFSELHEQFGSNSTTAEFTRQFMTEANWVRKTLWPTLMFSTTREQRFLLSESPHPTPIRSKTGKNGQVRSV